MVLLATQDLGPGCGWPISERAQREGQDLAGSVGAEQLEDLGDLSMLEDPSRDVQGVL